MDFIEKLTGLSPDGGDGSTELLFVIVTAVPALVVVLLVRPYGLFGTREVERV